MGTIYLALAAGAAGIILWVLNRWFSKPREIMKLQEQVDEITKAIIRLEKEPHSYSRTIHLHSLYNDRLCLNTRIKRLRPK